MEGYYLYYIISHYDLPFSLEEVAEHFVSVRDGDFLELENAANTLGFKTHIITSINWQELAKIPTPAIFFRKDSSPHFFIVKEVCRWSVLFLNPRTGAQKRWFRWQFLRARNYAVLVLLPSEIL